MKTISKVFLLSTAIFTISVFGVLFATSVNAAQNASPCPNNCSAITNCNGANWNIGSPDGATCSGSVVTQGALQDDPKAMQILGGESRLEPESPGGLATMNKFCQVYTGESSSYATHAVLHRYCGGGNNNSWWTGSNWSKQYYGAGKLNVQQVTCATGCSPVPVPTPVPTPVVNVNNSPIGSFDSVDNGNCQITGWAKDPDFPNSTIHVDIYKDGAFAQGGVYVAAAQANLQNHGFVYQFTQNSGLFDGQNHQIYVYGIDTTGGTDGSNALLNGSPRTIICQPATQPTIICSNDSQCGTNAFTGSPFCQGNSVYQNFKTFTCNNPGTSTSYCSNNTASQLKNDCTANQTCNNGSCVNKNIACSTNNDCGNNSLTGNPFCQNNDVFTNQLTYFCNDPGTAQSFCSNSLVPQLTRACGTNKTCVNGNCASQNIACGSNSECGSNGLTGNAFCQNGNAYKNYITYSCNNAGTNQSFCSNSLTPQLTATCSPSQTCTNGSCATSSITCSTNAKCGVNGYIGNPFCQDGNVYQNYKTFTCNNSGTATSYCSESTDAQLKTTCAANQTCANGTCGNTVNNCTSHSSQQCSGNNLYWYDSCGNQQESQYCPNGCANNSCQNNNNSVTVQTNSATNVYGNSATLNGYLYTSNNNNNSCNSYVWFQYGTSAYYGSETAHMSQNNSGSFNQNINNINSGNTYHFRAVAQGCSGNLVYGQDMTTSSQQTNGYLTISKTVRDLTNGSGFANSVSAAPGDMLMFMITLQATGSQDVQNVVVRDNLPTNLIYNNQLVVACSGNNNNNNNNYNNCNGANYNYNGNISSGVNLNTIYAGQTVTITYQTQVASAQNFSYGTTTLNNSVNVTSSNGSNPTASASVIVNRTAVYGASSISTGLTNNFWVDSFFLPLLIALIGIWIWKSGIFFGIEKWLKNKKKTKIAYNSEKELASRIATIQKLERA